MDIIESHRAFNGTLHIARHASMTTGTDMTFSIFVPARAEEEPCPVLWYLSGLTCTHANATEKGEYRAPAAAAGVIVVCPDTSPRGDGVPTSADGDWQVGFGAGFYVDATQEPWATHYRMYSYMTEELPALVAQNFKADMQRQGIFGHSMGGHGALTIALKNPDRYRSCSAFAPITSPRQSELAGKAFTAYLGADEATWRAHDACALIEDGARVSELLVDQGDADPFLETGLKPELLARATAAAGIPCALNMRAGYDHSYYFVSTFMAEHIAWHAERLRA